ncbi:hypothetical protein KGQ25_01850 [Patescibacteria group bacterium]|nr:hypothetical protein [Patescibacteria group bacterium]
MSGRRLSVTRGSPSTRAGERLAARRKSKRRRAAIALGVLFLLLCGAVVYGFQQEAVRISDIQVFGASQSFADIARAAMRGNYLGLIPRNSTFFFPASSIRANIIAAHPDVAAVALFRSGLTGLSVKVDERIPIATWCPPSFAGAGSIASSTATTGCYLFDADGFIYATTSAARPLNSFIVYEPLATSGGDPIGSTLPNAAKLPTTFDFARQLATFGSPVSAIVFGTDNEVDDYLASGTRVTYILGNEQTAFAALTSAQADFNLADGSVDYVDLRFDGKIYLKKK